MNKIRLQVICKYSVDIELDNVPSDMVEQLEDSLSTVNKNSDVGQWLLGVINESDAEDWEFEIKAINQIQEES
jgi:hypothetical protein